MKTYACDFYEWHGAGSAAHDLTGMESILNKRAGDGWLVSQFIPVAIGFVIVFEKPGGGAGGAPE